jgi:hypothetical protein
MLRRACLSPLPDEEGRLLAEVAEPEGDQAVRARPTRPVARRAADAAVKLERADLVPQRGVPPNIGQKRGGRPGGALSEGAEAGGVFARMATVAAKAAAAARAGAQRDGAWRALLETDGVATRPPPGVPRRRGTASEFRPREAVWPRPAHGGEVGTTSSYSEWSSALPSFAGTGRPGARPQTSPG